MPCMPWPCCHGLDLSLALEKPKRMHACKYLETKDRLSDESSYNSMFGIIIIIICLTASL